MTSFLFGGSQNPSVVARATHTTDLLIALLFFGGGQLHLDSLPPQVLLPLSFVLPAGDLVLHYLAGPSGSDSGYRFMHGCCLIGLSHAKEKHRSSKTITPALEELPR